MQLARAPAPLVLDGRRAAADGPGVSPFHAGQARILADEHDLRRDLAQGAVEPRELFNLALGVFVVTER